MEKFFKILLTFVLMLLPLLLKAQTCTELYSRGVEMRKTMRIDAQNQAIYLFQQARECFTEQADKDRCEKQIQLCIKAITRMGGTPVLNQNADTPASGPQFEEDLPETNTAANAAEPTEEPAVTAPAKPEPEPEPEPAVEAPAEAETTAETETPAEAETTVSDRLRIEETLEFAPKNADVRMYDYDTAEAPVIKYKPEWVKVSFQDGKILITVDDNDGAERSGRLIIAGNSMDYFYNINQKRKKGFLGL